MKIIEHDQKRCEYLASQLPSSMLILNGDGADEDLLLEESVGEMDMFLALTSEPKTTSCRPCWPSAWAPGASWP